MPAKSSITTQYFPDMTIPIIEGVSPKQPFTLRQNATAKIATPLEGSGVLTVKIKGLDPNITVFPQNNQFFIFGVGPQCMVELSTIYTIINAKFPRNMGPEYTGPWMFASIGGPQPRNFSVLDHFDIITKDTELTYTITPYINGGDPEDWGFTISETIPGRTPDETTTATMKFPPGTNVTPHMTVDEVFPMYFYIGWCPDSIEQENGDIVPIRGYIGNQIYTQVHTPGYNHGLIYTEVSIA